MACIFVYNNRVNAITLPWLSVSSNNYSKGDKVNLDNINELQVGKTLQLYGMLIYGSDMYIPGEPDSTGLFVDETNLSGIGWSSSNTKIASVDNTGKVTGIAEGTVVISANYDDKSVDYSINVVKTDDKPNVHFMRKVPPHPVILNKTNGLLVFLKNIPATQIKNIKFNIENSDIAKIESINSESDGGSIIVNVKGLKVGTTKITANLNYNENNYSDTLTFDVVKNDNLNPNTGDGILISLTAIMICTVGLVLSIHYFTMKKKKNES